MQIKSILGLPFETLKEEFIRNGFSLLDAKRVFPWIHQKLVKTFEEMSDVPKRVREKLPDFFSLERPRCKILQESSDGTVKVLLEFKDNNCVETVFIPNKKRNTICVSSQVGCPIGCRFCNTGTQQFCRNLTSSEIMSQIIFWIERQKKLNAAPITNIVFMGMGEPLLNSQNLFAVLEILLNKKTYNFSRNKITVSTSGIVDDSIIELAKFRVKLAVSLHASNDKKRSELMPINNKYKISEVLSAVQNYHKLSNTSHITFEYLLLDGINDSYDDAIELSKLLGKFGGARARVNLIMFNSWNGSKFTGASDEKANHFSKILLSRGIRTIIRKSRGRDIFAACGQLKSEDKMIYG
jgi:23S rRNA (adenine2503-C2)-methyltransferase